MLTSRSHAVLGVFCCLVLMPTLARSQSTVQAPAHDFGLFIQGEKRIIPLPLAETKVRGSLNGFAAHVEVTQVYVNPYDAVIEATYVFPLPEQAAIHSMVMQLADRQVVAEIKTRHMAERIYEEAVSAGHTAALMTQERPNIFTQKVGNIPPGEKIEVRLTYVEVLTYAQGVSTFVFPTVVGPRYIPGLPLNRQKLEASGRSLDTPSVPDASRMTPPVLGSNQSSVHAIDLEMRIAPQLPIRALRSPSHIINVDSLDAQHALVRIAAGDKVPNKDFVLHIDVRGKRPAVTVLTHRQDDDSGYLSLVVQPPALPEPDMVAAKDLFFVVDNSGSMSGPPLDAAKALVRQALRQLNPDDRFTIMRFSDSVSALSATPLENTGDNIRRGLAFIDAMQGMGGTEMLSGIRRALEGSSEPGRIRIVFFLTDGYIGNDDEILAAVKNQNQAQARLFSLGVGSSVNRYLLNSMARLGRGEAQFMRYDEEVEPFVEKFYQRVRNPVLTDVSLHWGSLSIEGQTPEVIGDLYDGQPLLVHARYRHPGKDQVTLRGYLGHDLFEWTLDVELPERAERPELASIWARAKISAWMDVETSRPGQHQQDITEMALKHSLMSKYTAFVAVDRERIVRRAHEPLIPVAQRLPLPDGVSRRALGDLSRREIPPGDPIIEVAAPADARRVTAYFPFGLIKQLRYDDKRSIWRGRFLVPAGIPDGIYSILIVIEHADGRVQQRRESYRLDSAAEEFVALFSGEVLFAGDDVDLYVDSIEPAYEVYVHCPALAWERLPLLAVDGDRHVDWEALLPVPVDAAAGDYSVLVVVRDKAGNRLEQRSVLHINLARSL